MTPINYVEPPDIPAGMTIRQWRAQRWAGERDERVRPVRALRRQSSRITWCNGFELVGKVAAQAGLRILTSSLPRVEGKTRVLA